MKYILMIALMFAGTTSFAGECVSGKCSVRSRVVNVTKEVVSVPVKVARRTVQATKNLGKRTVSRVRSVVR